MKSKLRVPAEGVREGIGRVRGQEHPVGRREADSTSRVLVVEGSSSSGLQLLDIIGLNPVAVEQQPAAEQLVHGGVERGPAHIALLVQRASSTAAWPPRQPLHGRRLVERPTPDVAVATAAPASARQGPPAARCPPMPTMDTSHASASSTVPPVGDAPARTSTMQRAVHDQRRARTPPSPTATAASPARAASGVRC